MLHIYTLCGNLLVWQEIRQNKLDGYDQSIMNYQQWQTSEDSGRIEKVKLEETVTTSLTQSIQNWSISFFMIF